MFCRPDRRPESRPPGGGKIPFPPGTLVVMDQGYVDYDGWNQLTHPGVYFVTRLKKDLHEVVTQGEAEKQEEIQFLTHPLELGATTLARLYKERRQIEIFFQSLKPLLRIKTFVGTSANALQTQIGTALMALLILKYLKLRSRLGWSWSHGVAWLGQQRFVYRHLAR